MKRSIEEIVSIVSIRKLKKLTAFCFFIFSISIFANGPTNNLAPVVHVQNGFIVGKIENNVGSYLGIPYAAPPVGKLRWADPQPAASWKTMRKAVNYSLVCPQANYKKENTSEDCLYLNVWVPTEHTKKPWPVMVWIHGGGFVGGSGTFPLYNGSQLASHGVIVVTFNYRLGPFGFFAHSKLSAESSHDTSGDYGLLDQIAALKWVKQNIAAFDGDPKNVTVFGESAGGDSVNILMVSPLAKNLFHRAIVESGPLAWSIRPLRKKIGKRIPGETMGEMISKNLGCDTAKDELACLRSQSYESLMNAANKNKKQLNIKLGGFIFTPVVDGYVIPDNPMRMYQEGKQANIPLIIGTNQNEGKLFLRDTFPDVKTEKQYQDYVKKTFGKQADKIFQLFPVKNDSDVAAALDKLLTYKWFRLTMLLIADAKVEKHQAVWVYQFTHQPPARISKIVYPMISDSSLEKLGVAHGFEMPYVFGSFDKQDGTAVDEKIAQEFMSYWTQFAKTGNPNSKKTLFWPKYSANKQYLNFGDTLSVQSYIRPPWENVSEEKQVMNKD